MRIFYPVPDISKPTMDVIIDDLNSPGCRVNTDANWVPVVDSVHRMTKLVRFPWFNLGFRTQTQHAGSCRETGCVGSRYRQTHPLHRISGAKVFDLPLCFVN